jgi:AcrR family transcriptional regulator
MPRSEELNRELQSRQRANLLSAAERLLYQANVPLTMERLADEAGVSQGLAYRYFPSKEALYRAVVASVARRTPPLRERLDQLPGGPRERIRFVVERVLELGRTHAEFQQFMVRSWNDPELPAAVRRTLEARFAGFREGMRALIVAAQRAGEIADDDPDELTSALLALLAGLRPRASLHRGTAPTAALPRPEVVLRVLGEPPGRRRRGPDAAHSHRPRRAAPPRPPARSRASTSQSGRHPFQSARVRAPGQEDR